MLTPMSVSTCTHPAFVGTPREGRRPAKHAASPSAARPNCARTSAPSLEISLQNENPSATSPGPSLSMSQRSIAVSTTRRPSRPALPHAMQDSLPAGGLRLCRAGVEPAGSLREVWFGNYIGDLTGFRLNRHRSFPGRARGLGTPRIRASPPGEALPPSRRWRRILACRGLRPRDGVPRRPAL